MCVCVCHVMESQKNDNVIEKKNTKGNMIRQGLFSPTPMTMDELATLGWWEKIFFFIRGTRVSVVYPVRVGDELVEILSNGRDWTQETRIRFLFLQNDPDGPNLFFRRYLRALPSFLSFFPSFPFLRGIFWSIYRIWGPSGAANYFPPLPPM